GLGLRAAGACRGEGPVGGHVRQVGAERRAHRARSEAGAGDGRTEEVMTASRLLSMSIGALGALGSIACGGGSQESAATPVNAVAAQGKGITARDDQSRCDFKGRTDREVVESSGPGALVPNVRRVFGILGEGDDRRRVLFCREIDTNLDGLKDVVRT